jgi:hypothetical protein
LYGHIPDAYVFIQGFGLPNASEIQALLTDSSSPGTKLFSDLASEIGRKSLSGWIEGGKEPSDLNGFERCG